jgi:hypothetical protein
VTTPEVLQRSYGCTFGCGNPYDFIFISVRDGTTEFLCLPCMVRLASDMVEAVANPNDDQVAKWSAATAGMMAAPMSGNNAKRGRRNAPATNDDPDLFESFDSVITTEELPEAFQ